MHLSKTALALLAALLLIAWIALPLRLEVIGPRLGIPAIIEPGDEFTLTVRGSWPLWGNEWSVELQGAQAQGNFPASILNRQPLSAYRSVTLRSPEKLPPGSYNLAVKVGAASKTMPEAVHVVEEFPEDFSIVHIADLPVFGEPDGLGEAQMTELVAEINMINPDLVVAGGDIAYGASWANFQTLYDFLLQLEMPVVVAPGNHEYEAWNGYLAFFRQRYHSVDFGRWRIITIDSGHRRDQPTYSQMRWLEQTFAEHGDKPALINVHHPVFGERGFMVNVEPFMALMTNNNVPLVLSGHNHGDRLFDRDGQRRIDTRDLPPPLNIVTTSAGARIYPDESDSPLHNGYRLIRISGDEVVNFTYDYDGDGVRDVMSSIPVGRLQVSYRVINEALITNGLNESFDALRLRIPGGADGLVPDIGELVDIRRGETGYEYLVDVPVPANSRRQIKLVAGDKS